MHLTAESVHTRAHLSLSLCFLHIVRLLQVTRREIGRFFFPQFWPKLTSLDLFLPLPLVVKGSVVGPMPTLEFLQHLPHPGDAAHRLQLQGDGLWFQPCDSFASGSMQSPQVSVWSAGAHLPHTSHPTLIQK